MVCYMPLQNANHTVIRVLNTTQCHMIHQLVWYAHFIFTMYSLARVFTNFGVVLCVNNSLNNHVTIYIVT